MKRKILSLIVFCIMLLSISSCAFDDNYEEMKIDEVEAESSESDNGSGSTSGTGTAKPPK